MTENTTTQIKTFHTLSGTPHSRSGAPQPTVPVSMNEAGRPLLRITYANSPLDSGMAVHVCVVYPFTHRPL